MPRARSDPAGGTFLRTPRWYFIEFESREDELYDMAVDPDQAREVSKQHPEQVEEFRRRIRVWREEMGTAPPGFDRSQGNQTTRD